jgi:hypothetical protein
MSQLSPIAPDQLPEALAAFARGIAHESHAAAAFARIEATIGNRTDVEGLTRAALALCRRLGIAVIDEEPARAFSWDGRFLRTRSEPCVLFHEIAHWQLAPPDRRDVPDFGLGAGPETGKKTEADAARSAGEAQKINEEAEASLLGILWEAQFGGPAIDAFLEQNWLERFESEGTHRLFIDTIAALRARRLIDASAEPVAHPSAGPL